MLRLVESLTASNVAGQRIARHQPERGVACGERAIERAPIRVRGCEHIQNLRVSLVRDVRSVLGPAITLATAGFSVSTFPQYTWNILESSARRGITDTTREFLLPIEVAKKVGALRNLHWITA